MRIFLFSVWFFCFSNLFAQNSFDIQGHRGARGLFPENTIYGFVAAAKLGVTTLELDVVVSADSQLVVSHEPWFNASICELDSTKQRLTNLYQMTYSQISQIDCGSKGNSKFAEQKKIATVKPLLRDLIDTIEYLVSVGQLNALRYNIEIKSTQSGDNIYHPMPSVYAKLLYQLLKEKNVLQKSTVQSFDVRALKAMHELDAQVQLGYLVFNLRKFNANLRLLGFKPAVYSPNYILVKKKLVKQCHAQNIKLIPWTVNVENSIKKLIEWGVDGIISDYPNRVIKSL